MSSAIDTHTYTGGADKAAQRTPLQGDTCLHQKKKNPKPPTKPQRTLGSWLGIETQFLICTQNSVITQHFLGESNHGKYEKHIQHHPGILPENQIKSPQCGTAGKTVIIQTGRCCLELHGGTTREKRMTSCTQSMWQ